MIEILHYLKDPKLWELWYVPYYGFNAGFTLSTVCQPSLSREPECRKTKSRLAHALGCSSFGLSTQRLRLVGAGIKTASVMDKSLRVRHFFFWHMW